MGRILIIRGGAIGDFILTLPAIRLIREQLPDNQIEILGYKAVADLAVASGYADAVRHIEYSALASFFANGGKLDPPMMDYFARFNIVVSYLYDPDGHFHANLDRSGVRTLLECSHRVDAGGEHASRQLAKPLEQLALFFENDAAAAPKLDLDSLAGEADAILREAGLSAGRFLAIHPGSGSLQKNWPLERWMALGPWLAEQAGGEPILLVSGEAEEDTVDQVAAAWRRAGVRFAPARNLALPALGAILSKARLFAGHDSGISHLAAAAGAPCALLFGPTDPAIWAPPHAGVRILRAADSALPSLSAEAVKSLIASALG